MPPFGHGIFSLSCLILCCALSACTPTPVQKKVKGQEMASGQLLQSDSNRIANLAMRDNLDSLQLLLEKLYKRNPIMWKKRGESREQAIEQVMQAIIEEQPLADAPDHRSIGAMTLAFDPTYQGDRAGSLIYGLGTMLYDLYGERTEHYLLHGLDAQKLANASYNIEVAAWMLSQKRNPDGSLMLISNELSEQGNNLTFEREFGKMIGRLDLLAVTMDEKYRRIGINYLQGLVGAPLLQFLPISAAADVIRAAGE